MAVVCADTWISTVCKLSHKTKTKKHGIAGSCFSYDGTLVSGQWVRLFTGDILV